MSYRNDALGHLGRAADALPFIPAAAASLQEYWDLGGNSEGRPPYQQIMCELDSLIGKLKRLRQQLQELEAHQHQWGDDDYCIVCHADGRA